MTLGAVIFAKRLDRLVEFYSSFGFRVVETHAGDHTILSGSGSELVIIQIPEPIAADIEIATPPRVRSETPIKLSFAVPSIDAALKVAASLGGTVDGESQHWDFRGHVFHDAVDPEGNVYQLRQVEP